MTFSAQPHFVDLAAAVLAALRPRSWRERARARWVGGWTCLQVLERMESGLAEAWRASFAGPEVVRERAMVEALRVVLLRLSEEGRVRRATARYTTELISKGHRDMVVDVFRLA